MKRKVSIPSTLHNRPKPPFPPLHLSPEPPFALSANLTLAPTCCGLSRSPSRCQATKRGANDSPSATAAAASATLPERSGEPVRGLEFPGTADPGFPLDEVAAAAAAASPASTAAAAAASSAAAGSAAPAAAAVPASTAGFVEEEDTGKGPPAAGGLSSRREAFAKVSRYRLWRQDRRFFSWGSVPSEP